MRKTKEELCITLQFVEMILNIFMYRTSYVYVITNWHRFYFKFMYVKAKGKQESRKESVCIFKLSVYFIPGGIFASYFLLGFSFDLQSAAPFSRQSENFWKKKRQPRRNLKGKKGELSSPCVCTRLCLSHKKGTWMFFHYISCEFSSAFVCCINLKA